MATPDIRCGWSTLAEVAAEPGGVQLLRARLAQLLEEGHLVAAAVIEAEVREHLSAENHEVLAVQQSGRGAG